MNAVRTGSVVTLGETVAVLAPQRGRPAPEPGRPLRGGGTASRTRVARSPQDSYPVIRTNRTKSEEATCTESIRPQPPPEPAAHRTGWSPTPPWEPSAGCARSPRTPPSPATTSAQHPPLHRRGPPGQPGTGRPPRRHRAAQGSHAGPDRSAWLLARAPWIVPIPGTRRPERLEENLAAAQIELSDDDLAQIRADVDQVDNQGARHLEHLEPSIDR